MAKIKEEKEEFTTSFSLILDGVCLFVSFLNVVGPMMTVMAISFTLPFHFSKKLFELRKMISL